MALPVLSAAVSGADAALPGAGAAVSGVAAADSAVNMARGVSVPPIDRNAQEEAVSLGGGMQRHRQAPLLPFLKEGGPGRAWATIPMNHMNLSLPLYPSLS